MPRFRAEWEKQSAVIIAWPHKSGDFSHQIKTVEETYRLIAKAIIEQQRLIIICKDAGHQTHIEKSLPGRLHFVHANYNDIWVRDTAPLTIETDRGYQLLNFQFNGWGKKYPYQDDNAINRQLCKSSFFADTPIRDIDMILEGGSVETDGQGTLLTTRQCLLNTNRNPHLCKRQIEQKLRLILGVKRFLWLDQDKLAGDDTDAHIDTLARFCSAGHIAYSSCENPNDVHYSGLKKMRKQLEKFITPSGKPYQLTALPLPEPVYNDHGKRLPANYANFLIINNALLLPVYNDPMDAVAMERIGNCFPKRKIIAIPSLPLIHQYGSLHCMSMQIPG